MRQVRREVACIRKQVDTLDLGKLQNESQQLEHLLVEKADVLESERVWWKEERKEMERMAQEAEKGLSEDNAQGGRAAEREASYV